MPQEINRTPHKALDNVKKAARTAAIRFVIPAEMITLHGTLKHAKLPDGKTLQGRGQRTLRWGAFLLTYAPLEGFFQEIGDPDSNRTLPLSADKIREKVKRRHGVALFTNDWQIRTAVPPLDPENNEFHEVRTYDGTDEIRQYLNDMRTLRNRLSHGNDPYPDSNDSGALWKLQERFTMRMLGVEGFLIAAKDLVNATLLAFGGTSDDFPNWPAPTHDVAITPPRD